MRNYNKHMRPVRNDKEMVVVDFTIKLKQIVDIDERDQMLKLNIQINQSWTDQLLQWDPADYRGTSELRFPATQIWRPDTTLYNT
ncbi:neuronal acetylcholine receptor subunit alpha-7 [Strongylocentrotus purpuratus]|uniref:Neurotransmitter-gated ion-channel ligand-binding domain-containing protein n=1 Tax=Strongylocentrotus purpuratus TaxID=7668 RepID=A0A7M7PGE4_STRPU|nr:neuronal acetylcholine receptor subunit alpha-7 [Strongylocentrotus purpuratus]